jgi:steroid 5-alpha reductase family enzyme
MIDDLALRGNASVFPQGTIGALALWRVYYLYAAAAGGWWKIFSPALMTYLLTRVSGAALLEKMLKEQKPGYREYVETTSGFIPWFPRKRKQSEKE